MRSWRAGDGEPSNHTPPSLPSPCLARSSRHRKQPWVCRVNRVLFGGFPPGKRRGRRGRLDTLRLHTGKIPWTSGSTRRQWGGTMARPRAMVTGKPLSCASAKVPIPLAFAKQIEFELIVAWQNSTWGFARQLPEQGRGCQRGAQHPLPMGCDPHPSPSHPTTHQGASGLGQSNV